jgi:glycosyltransferase involved in cell wall biosynthesis
MSELLRVYRHEKPDVVHHVAVKPVLYGSLIARLTGVTGTVNALAGLGFLFSSKQLQAQLLRPLVVQAYRLAINGRTSRLILQNPDDAALLRDLGVVRDSTGLAIIRGSGVDVAAYPMCPEPSGIPLVVLPARMLWDKGVGDFVEAARRLRQRGIRARFALVGDRDNDNPAAIPEAQLGAWREEGVVEWWGFRQDMAGVFANANVVCLPSFREGLPKVLIEAACCGRAIVATDVPGCREVVRHHDNGMLVPVRDPTALADALEVLVGDRALRAQMGSRGRERVLAEFRAEHVIEATLRVYREVMR